MDKLPTPVLDDWKDKSRDHQAIVEFFDWLEESGYFVEIEPPSDVVVSLDSLKVANLAYKFLGIDKRELETKRQEILRLQREVLDRMSRKRCG